MKLVFVLVDALKSNYLTAENMPFLFRFSRENRYIKRVIPSPGFCERCEIISGLDCYDTGNFTAIGYDPEHGDYANESLAVGLANALSRGSYRAAKALLGRYRFAKNISMKPYRIPLKVLKDFTLTEDGSIQRIRYETILDMLEKTGKRYSLDAFTSLADIHRKRIASLPVFVQNQLDAGTDFIPVYIGDIDAAGHKYGSNIDAIRPRLQAVDNELKQLYTIAKAHDSHFAVLGDHGMEPVTNQINVAEIVASCEFTLHKQYEMFLDSTIAHFWFFDDAAAKYIHRLLTKSLSDYGTFIDHANAVDYRIPMDVKEAGGKSIYGDLLWCANPGILISPDYFNPATPLKKGMHGYLQPDTDNGNGLFVSTQTEIKTDSARLKEICTQLCGMLEVDVPNALKWRREIL